LNYPAVNHVTFFKDYREVHHPSGDSETKWISMRKTIYSLPTLLALLRAANHRYLAFVSLIETPEAGVTTLEHITESRSENNHTYKGFNPLADDDATLFRVLLREEFCISGLSSRSLRRILVNKTAGQITRLLKRLRVHGLIKKVGSHYKYYLTTLGRIIAVTALRLRELYVIPQLVYTRVP